MCDSDSDSDSAVRLAEERGAAVRRPIAATAAVFFVNGLLFASWTVHIPQVKEHLGLTDAALGVALLGAPVGSVTAMLVSARQQPRRGPSWPGRWPGCSPRCVRGAPSRARSTWP